MEAYGNSRSWQARLQMKHDQIKRKLIDNNIAHEGNPTDCIRLRLKADDEGDYQDRIIENADIVHIIFPPMKDVPVRSVMKDHKLDRYTVTSLPKAADDEKHEEYSIVAPQSAQLLPGDLLVRVMIDPKVSVPLIFCLEVVEALGTFGGSMLIMMKYNCSLYNEELDSETLEVIAEMAKRRLYLEF